MQTWCDKKWFLCPFRNKNIKKIDFNGPKARFEWLLRKNWP